MVTNFALCCIVILSHGGYRQVFEFRGKIVDDNMEYWRVDFEEEFKKHKINLPYVFKVKGNDCLYVK